ncbi:MAG: CHAP domain-containing protein [Clostridia bacterium]|nr:CHAP domain-containing protein [Clostridia bacterium]
MPCTRYAWQQTYDRLGIALPNWGNAINWLDRATSAGYSTGSVAKANSIAVWKSSAHSYGHVSFVTAVNGNYMTVNEGGMTNSSGGAANGTGIVTGSTVSSVVGTKKSAYSSCTLLGFIYLSGTPSNSVNISSYSSKNSISEKNAILWGKVDKPSNYSVTKIGIRVRVDGGSYSSAWSKYETPSKNYVGETVMYPYYNLKDELALTLTHVTKYYYQFYSMVNGKEYWSAELSFTTTGSHSYGAWSTQKAASCTESGTKICKCTGCSKTKSEAISALGHNFASSYTVDKAATCTTLGSKSKHCSRCSATTSNTTISAMGHSYGNWNMTKQATCTTKGSSERKCSKCSQKDTKAIAALGHNCSTEWVIDKKATCTESGSKSHHCSRCNYICDITTISPLNHSWSEFVVTKKATINSQGEKTRNCTRANCNATEKITIAMLAEDGHEHDFEEWETVAENTCVNDGLAQRKCSICQQSENKTIAASGHKFGGWETILEATNEKDGLLECFCAVCGERKSKIISKISNVDSSSVENNGHLSDEKKNLIIPIIITCFVISAIVIIYIMKFKKRK